MAIAVGAESEASRGRANEILTPYVPRLVVDWLRETPDALHREVEGSMVFVDISGFTALSERLARRGKIGAELMRDTLNVVFVALLDEAYDYGAGLLKWGGDALLLLFDGPGHEVRACRAAWEMQRALDRVGRLKAGGGTVTLRMSVGITTGTFQFLLVGSVHRELLIMGPAVTETVAMESIADAGDVAVSPALAERLDPALLGRPKDVALLLAAAPAVERKRAPDIGDVSGIDIPACIPIAARAHVLLDRSEPEHRTITAAFIDLMDTDTLLLELGLAGFADALDQRLRSIQESALAYDVPFYESDVGEGSIKVLLTAGAPSSTGHDEERMLRALREIIEAPGVVPLRIGANTGKVFTGDFGPRYRRSYRVFGDAINTAARVMSRAQPGQILATEVVLERSRTLFESTPIEPFAAKGKSEPLRASIVGPVTGTKQAHRAGTALIGRESEIATVLAAFDAARRGKGCIVEIVGAAGIGKSRFVEELIERSPDVFVFHARCEEYEASTPYYPMRAPIRAVLGLDPDADTPEVEARLREAVARVDPVLVPWIPLLGILLGLDLPGTPETEALDDRFLRERLGEVTMKFLYTSLAGTATMLAIEDAHFMDEATRDLLLRLARAGSDLRQIMLVTHSDASTVWAPQGEDEPWALSLCLLPLPFRHTIAIAELATDDNPLPPHYIEEIARRSNGNALFLFELLETVRQTGSTDSLPDSIESLIAGDIDRLSPEDRTVLRYAAVLGASFDPRLLEIALRQEVTLDDEVWERLADLVDAEHGGTKRFRNTLVRDAAYEGLPYRRRRELHNRIGEAIEATAGVSVEEEVGALALHFDAAQRWDKAWEYSRAAGDRAMNIYANAEATRFLERAASAARKLRSLPPEELGRVYEALGESCLRLGEFERAGVAFRKSRHAALSDSVERARLMLKEAQGKYRIGLYVQAMRWIEKGLREIETDSGKQATAQRAALHAWKGALRVWQGRAREAIVWCEKAIDEARISGAREPLAHAFFVLDFAFASLGRFDEAVHSTLALEIYEELGDLDRQALILNNLGGFAFEQGRWDEASARWERAQELWEQAGDRSRAAWAVQNRGELLCDQGHLEEAELLLREALRVTRASRSESGVASVATTYGLLAARAGQFEHAHDLLNEARDICRREGAHAELLIADARLAECLIYEGRSREALEVADDALHRTASVEGGFAAAVRLQLVRGWALLQEGRVGEAGNVLVECLEAARKQGAEYDITLALDALVTSQTVADPHAMSAERDRIRNRLGVVVTTSVPGIVKP